MAQGLLALIEKRQSDSGGKGVDVIGIATGFPDLNYIGGGYRKQEIYAVGGATGSGKSSFCLSEAIKVAEQGGSVVYFSLEMSAQLLALRTISAMTNLSAMKIERGQLSQETLKHIKEAVESFNKLPLYFFDYTVTTDQAKDILWLQQDKKGLDIAVVDYVALMGDLPNKSGYERVTAIMDRLKGHATDFDIPMIVASQLNRASLTGKPTLSALKESGQVENNSGMVIFPYRVAREEGEELEDPDVEPALLIIAKNRFGPSNVEIPAEFLPSKMTWRPKEYEIVDPHTVTREKRSIA